MNKVILSGRLVRDIELRNTPSGKEVVANCIAVKRDYKNSNGEYDSDFINIVVWGASATYLKNYAAKGDMVELVGRWQTRTYEDNNGQNRTISECIVESITAFNSKPKEEKKKPTLEEIDYGDCPF